MKKFVSGFLVGAILFAGAGVYAASYVASPVNFKVLVNGQEFVSDPLALSVEGRTYLPLRAIGEALGVSVNWNEELRQVEVGDSGALAPAGKAEQYNRLNPAPLNTVQRIDVDNYNGRYSMSLKITEIIRGENEIYKKLKQVAANDTAEKGYELMLVKIAASLLNVEGDKAINIDSTKFLPYTSNNEETKRAYIYLNGEDGFCFLDNKMFAGGNTEGYIAIQVKKDDPAPKIAYELDYDGVGGIWFALY